MISTANQCPEFPFFGASYPDACCIDGYLWDLDKYEDGKLYGGGEVPCPFCNRELFLEYEGAETKKQRRKVLAYIERLKRKYQPAPAPVTGKEQRVTKSNSRP